MDVKLPALGEGADSGTVVNLFVKEGDQIAEDQAILELENEKAVATIPSPAAGAVLKVHVKVGDKISVGQRLLTVDGGPSDTPAKAPGKPKAAPSAAKAKGETPSPEPEPEAESDSDSEGDQPETPSDGAPAASPAIRQLARELKLDLNRIRGTARGGRITIEDLRGYIGRLQKLEAQPRTQPGGAPPKTAAAEPIDFSRWGPVSRKPFTSLRQVIARRMQESRSTIPDVTQFEEADVTGVLALRKKHVDAYEKKGARLTLTSFVLKAVAQTLKQHPAFNSSLDEAAQEIVFKDYIHLGVAVDTEAGLMVPVIRDADKKDLVQLSKDLEELAAKARDRKISADELKGGTFTISNQGAIGGAHFTPIINKPEVAILGLGKGAAKPVVRDGKIEIRTLMPVCLSYDHRVVDGAAAARFIVDLVRALENWSDGDME